MFYQKKNLLAATIMRFEYSPLCSELKKQTGIAKDQYQFFKDQVDVSYNNKEDDVKAEVGVITEDGEITDNLHLLYIFVINIRMI